MTEPYYRNGSDDVPRSRKREGRYIVERRNQYDEVILSEWFRRRAPLARARGAIHCEKEEPI